MADTIFIHLGRAAEKKPTAITHAVIVSASECSRPMATASRQTQSWISNPKPGHTRRSAVYFKTHKIQSFLNLIPSQFSMLTPGRSVLDMQQNCMCLPPFLSVCLQEVHTLAHPFLFLFVFFKADSSQGVFNESFLIQNGLENKIR